MYLYDTLDNGQADSGTFGFIMEPIKQAKYLLVVLGVNADAIVPDVKDGLITIASESDLHEALAGPP
jgi:hypothetical protein